MKTAMQELILWVGQYEGKMISADQVVLKAYDLLEKEKYSMFLLFDWCYGLYDNLTDDEKKEIFNSGYNHYFN